MLKYLKIISPKFLEVKMKVAIFFDLQIKIIITSDQLE